MSCTSPWTQCWSLQNLARLQDSRWAPLHCADSQDMHVQRSDSTHRMLEIVRSLPGASCSASVRSARCIAIMRVCVLPRMLVRATSGYLKPGMTQMCKLCDCSMLAALVFVCFYCTQTTNALCICVHSAVHTNVHLHICTRVKCCTHFFALHCKEM